MARKYFLILLLVFLAFIAIGQTSVGIRAGVNFAGYDHNPYSYIEPISKVETVPLTGLDIAVFANFPIGHFSLQPELHWIQKGFRAKAHLLLTDDITFEPDYQNMEMVYLYDYLEIPVLLKYEIGTDKFRVHPFIGPSIGYALQGGYTEKMKDTEGGDEKYPTNKIALDWDKENGENFKKDIRLDFSLSGGIGFEVTRGKGDFLVDFRYNKDLNSQVRNEKKGYADNFRNRSVGFTMGYCFHLK